MTVLLPNPDSRPAQDWTRELLVGGKLVSGEGPDLEVWNPATAELTTSIASASEDQVDKAVASARTAFESGLWPRMSGRERSAALHKLADGLEAKGPALAEGLVTEIGTPISLARTGQTALAVMVLREYADLAARDSTEYLAPHFDPVPSSSLVARRPMGVVAVITAYNFPILLTFRALGAALAAGCTVVVLPSPRSPLTTLMLNDMFASLPPGTVNTVIGGPEVGVRLTTHPGVDKVAFTGSMAVGAQIMKQAADSAKSVSLELGDKSAALILPDADLASLMPTIHFGYLANSGQSCGSTTRMIVPDSRHDEFIELSRQFLEDLPVGDPWNEETAIGPLIRKEHLDSVRGRVDQAIRDGAKLVASGSNSAELPGWYMEPVLLDEVDNHSMVAQTELFGPVGTVIRYDGDVERAIAIANDTPYGLHAKVFTADTNLGLQVAGRLRAGSVQVNGGGFRPDAPFGGMKASGIGREYGHWGIEEFSEVQHVQWVTA